MHWLHMRPRPCSSPAAPSPLLGSFNGSFGSGPGGAFVLGREQWEPCARTGAAGKASPREPLAFPGCRLGRGSQQGSSSVRKSHRPWSGGWPVSMIPLARLSKFQKSEKLFKILDFGFHRKKKVRLPGASRPSSCCPQQAGAELHFTAVPAPPTALPCWALPPSFGRGAVLLLGRQQRLARSLLGWEKDIPTTWGFWKKTEDGSISFWNQSSTWI